MTALTGGLLGIAAVAAVVDWGAVWIDGPRSRMVERVAKPAVLVALVLAALAWPMADGGSVLVRVLLVAALVASLAGDVFLLSPRRFIPGLVAFLLGHIAYTIAFAQLQGSAPWLLAGIAAAAVVVLTVGRALVRAAHREGLGMPVAVYLVAICAMAIAATRTGMPVAIVGAWLFVASDSMLGWGQFRAPAEGSDRGAARLRLAVIVTYHLGQVLLLLALVG